MIVPISLHEVFGIRKDISRHTYFDRGGLDLRLSLALRRQCHIAIYGPSKQGKSWLRRRHLPDPPTSLRAQCTIGMTAAQIYHSLLVQAGVELEGERESSMASKSRTGGQVSFGVQYLRWTRQQGGEVSSGRKRKTTPFPVDPTILDWISQQLSAAKKPLIVEDFHYLDHQERRQFASHLKHFFESGVYFVVVGIWAEQDLLTHYSWDLNGRVENIDLHWSDEEMDKVLQKGNSALNIVMPQDFRLKLIRASCGNIALLQRLAYDLCLESGVTATRSDVTYLDKQPTFEKVIQRCQDSLKEDYRARMRRLRELGANGTKAFLDGLVDLIEEASDKDLLEGIPLDRVMDRLVPPAPPNGSRRKVTLLLKKFAKLQYDAGLIPPLFAYLEDKQLIATLDREFAFVRRFDRDFRTRR
ncbi:MAG: hypothetical protein HY293_21955 [Planctomycetes bacterium]|nr:hypothetical protein [Planctomycetota bacterium]